MICHRRDCLVIALAALAQLRAAAADLAPLSSVELVELCRSYAAEPNTTEGQSCSAYVRGFLDGAADVILRASDADLTRGESFSERALRTRLGIRAPAPPEYCIDQEVSLQDLVVQLLQHAERIPASPELSASEMLYGVLSRLHRCRQ